MRVDFNIRRKHLKQGKARNMHSCAVALALQDTQQFQKVDVRSWHTTVLGRDGKTYKARNSRRVKDLIKVFDKGNKTKLIPGRYRLDFKAVS